MVVKKDGMVYIPYTTSEGTYLVRFFCAEFDIGSVDIAITDSAHSHGRLRKWIVRFVCMDLVLREVAYRLLLAKTCLAV